MDLCLFLFQCWHLQQHPSCSFGMTTTELLSKRKHASSTVVVFVNWSLNGHGHIWCQPCQPWHDGWKAEIFHGRMGFTLRLVALSLVHWVQSSLVQSLCIQQQCSTMGNTPFWAASLCAKCGTHVIGGLWEWTFQIALQPFQQHNLHFDTWKLTTLPPTHAQPANVTHCQNPNPLCKRPTTTLPSPNDNKPSLIALSKEMHHWGTHKNSSTYCHIKAKELRYCKSSFLIFKALGASQKIQKFPTWTRQSLTSPN